MEKTNKQFGFTLIEIMIAMVILGLLAAVAVPQYESYILKSRRTDAYSAMATAAKALERFYADNNQYDSTWTDIEASRTSVDGWYSMQISASVADQFQSYTLIATHRLGQVDDTDCYQFRLTHTGIRSATDTDGGDSTSICW